MKLIACDPLVGLPRVPIEGLRPDKADLLREMQRLGIEQALVRHRTALIGGPLIGNRVVLDEIQEGDPLLPTWFLTPDGEEPDFDVEQTASDMMQAGVKVAWTDPQAEGFSLLPWCAGPLYEALQARNMPLLLEYSKATPDQLDVILSNFPRLRLILLNVPRLGRNRMLYPLLLRHASLRLCLSHTYSVHKGFEDLCKRFGHERWVFGMGYPLAEGGAALAGLMYADISAEAKEAIAHGNIERMLMEVKQPWARQA